MTDRSDFAGTLAEIGLVAANRLRRLLAATCAWRWKPSYRLHDRADRVGLVDARILMGAWVFQAFDKNGGRPLAPADVEMLQGLISEYCQTRNLQLASPQANEAARDLVKWFQIGVTDPERLRELINST
ncbi:hypothetical protein FHX15_006037 [Rhizobium sp. BK650]|uniref:hypothetical protein n=1 Tax=Rhizobium sp. BK650 TaxID=2586990 RepID=UPI001608C64E|nr:hypothetical protein [Rhizobium sp. BK650]MBB3660766.1 hypothetical protein [Rhizobium sp. BK650]